MSTLHRGPAPRAARAAAVAAAALLLVCGGAASARADDGPTSIGSGGSSSSGTKAPNITFGIQPANPDGATPRTYFDLGADRGTVANDNVRITNYSENKLRLKVYAANAATALDGGYVVSAFAQAPADLAAWTKVTGLSATGFLSLPARTRIDLPVLITIPSTATPGDHAGAVVVSYFSVRRDAKGNTVDVENRVATRLYVRVAGPVRAGVSVSALHTTYDRSLLPWHRDRFAGTVIVRNTGTIRESISDALTIAGLLHGSQVVALGGPGDVLPGGSVRVTIPTQQLRPGIRAHITLTATARQVQIGPGGPAPVSGSGSAGTSVWTLPWPSLLALLLLAAGGFGFERWRRGRPAKPGPGKRRSGGAPVRSVGSLIDLTDPSAEPDGDRPQDVRLPQPAPTGRLPRAARATVAAVVLAPAMAVAALAAGMAPAQAATHRLYFAPATGRDVTPAYVVTDAGCPAGSSNVVGRAFGHGFPRAGQPVVNNSTSGVSHSAPFVIPLQDTLSAFAKLNRTTLQGSYRITLTCADRLQQQSTTVFEGVMRFDSAKRYRAAAPPASIVAAVQADQSDAGAPDTTAALGSEPGASGQPTDPAKPNGGSSAGSDSSSPDGSASSAAGPPVDSADGGPIALTPATKTVASQRFFTPGVAIGAGLAVLAAAFALIASQRGRRRPAPVSAPARERVTTPPGPEGDD